MCTSFTFKDAQGANALARTMDFAFVLDPDMVLVPRRYVWTTEIEGVESPVTYAFAGLGRHEGEFIFADGINEAGLACASLYFAGSASYSQQSDPDALNLAPHEVVFWMLANFSTAEEVRAAFQEVCVCEHTVELLGLVPPLHWIVTDKTGATIVIEPGEDGVVIHDNPVGVMANSPDFQWHMTNIRNYIGVNPNPVEPITLFGTKFSPFGQGSGTFGLPGDYTSPSRFLRVLFGKLTVEKPKDEKEALNSILHLLFSVDIPRGSVATDHGADYTQYSCAMFCESARYYFKTYDDSQLTMIDLHDHDLDADAPMTWSIPKTQQIKVLKD